MKKQAFLRALLGFPLGIALGYFITIIISLGWGQGNFYPCVPALAVTMGSELNAVVIQAILSGLLGSSFAASSIIWEIENWSIAKQTGIYFFITAVVMMPIAYINNWMEHTLFGVVVYFAIFALIFIIVWLMQYLIWKQKIKKMNDGIK